MTESATVIRAGQSDVPQAEARTHILVTLVEDRPGSVDRVIGVLRRRRAQAQSLLLGPTETPNIVRISAMITDSEVAVDHLVEHLRKIVDVHHVQNLTAQRTIARELALVKVDATIEHFPEIVAIGQQSGAAVIDATPETITFEVTGNQEKIAHFLQELQSFGVREVVRSGSVAISRGTGDR